MEMMDEKASHPKYWMPLVWAGAIVTRARKEKRISSDYVASQLMEKLDQFRGCTGGLLNYDWVTVPLVYTQVGVQIYFKWFIFIFHIYMSSKIFVFRWCFYISRL